MVPASPRPAHCLGLSNPGDLEGTSVPLARSGQLSKGREPDTPTLKTRVLLASSGGTGAGAGVYSRASQSDNGPSGTRDKASHAADRQKGLSGSGTADRCWTSTHVRGRSLGPSGKGKDWVLAPVSVRSLVSSTTRNYPSDGQRRLPMKRYVAVVGLLGLAVCVGLTFVFTRVQ